MEKAKTFFNLRLAMLLTTVMALLAFQVAALLPGVTTPFENVEYSARDTLMRLRGAQATPDNIVIVAIDDDSFKWTGSQWPWPRSYLAEIVKQINAGGGKIVGVDIFLFEPDKTPANDQAFADALGKIPSAAVIQKTEKVTEGSTTVSLSLPLPPYQKALDKIGITGFTRDEDAVVRSVQAYDTYNDKVYYHWAFEIASLYLGVDSPTRPTNTSVQFNGQSAPLRAGQLLVNFTGPAKTFPTYSAADVHDGITLEQNPNAFRDKIVLIGATTVTLQDVYPTPFSSQVPTPGVEIVASAIDTIISGKYLTEAPPWASLLIIIVAALVAFLISKSERPVVIVIALAVGMLGYLIVSATLLIRSQYILPVALPLTMLFLGVVLPTLGQAISQEREKQRVRNLFGRFISSEMIDQMMGAQDIRTLNKRANLSILFSDIRGFTTLSEKLSPDEVVNLLNPYLESMTGVIHKNRGTVDKYEGDAIVAFFGEPVRYEDHAACAVRTAVDMLKALEILSAQWIKEGRVEKGFNIGVGVNSGDVFVGMLGSEQRINYTIIGDNANLAARLQDLTKTYAWPILISESVYQQVKDEFDTEFADAVTVKGKTKPVNVYKVLGRKGAAEAEKVQPWQ